ncbi:MAG: cyclase family protein [Microvirga sp.]|nr:cyclase family protein [Microvirga sp.]
MRRRYGLLAGCCAAALLTALADGARAEYRPVTENTVVDLTGTVSMSHKQWWPGGERHHQPIIVPYIKHGPGPYAADLLIVDENTGAQFDCPPHMMPPQDSGLPNAGYWGTMTCEKVPAWQFMGEVVKVDGRRILDQAPNGVSPIFTVDMIKQTEQELGRSLGAGDAVLYWSRYVDLYDLPGDAGNRLHIDPLAGKAPAFPAPNFDAQDYLGSKGVRTVALDSPSIGAFGQPDYLMRGTGSLFQTPKAIESHLGLFKYGGIDIEGLINFDKVPNGALFIGLPVKHAHSPTAETRAVAITDPELSRELIAAVKARKVVDLTVVNAMDTPVAWPGVGIGTYAFPYMSVDPLVYFTGPIAPYWVNTHMVDSRTGTHLSPPAYYGPPPGFDISQYDAQTAAWRKEFEERYGTLNPTDMTSDKVPVHHLMGPARVIDVQDLVGTTAKSDWPASPRITVDQVKAYEQATGEIKAGEVVVFATGHTTTHFRPLERGRKDDTLKGPLDGNSEGWPAPVPEVVQYLAGKGVRHIATDAPSMGSVNPKEAAMTFWAGANAKIVFSEFLIGAAQLPPTGAFYIFLNPKIENNHGGPGRAIAILPFGQPRKATAMRD